MNDKQSRRIVSACLGYTESMPRLPSSSTERKNNTHVPYKAKLDSKVAVLSILSASANPRAIVGLARAGQCLQLPPMCKYLVDTKQEA